jgi:uncharacterized membrane protein (DUF441 family)
MTKWIAPRRKALVALVVGAVVTVAARNGLPLTEAQTAALTSLVAALFVFVVPNNPEV